jgi:hypothetical protein
VEVIVEPRTLRKVKRLCRRTGDEHRRRRGDPAVGGATRQPIVTAYRQQALAAALAAAEAAGTAARRPRDLKAFAPDEVRSM